MVPEKPASVKQLLSDRSLSPKKSLGQNFLVNPHVPETIASHAFSEAAARDGENVKHGVIEIGPGTGALTVQLAGLFDKVVAVEIDEGLYSLLCETLGDNGKIELVNEDFMKTDLCGLISEHFSDDGEGPYGVSICANLPYYITTPIIMKILESFDPSYPVPAASFTVMIQKEVADRLASPPGGRDYGAVTASIGLKATVKKLFDVSPGSFYPPPKVSSTVIAIIPHGGITEIFPDCPGERCAEFYRAVSETISAAFSQRRKTLVNALSGVYPKEKVIEALNKMGMREDIRGERLSPAEFCRLTRELGDY